jgi:23S rRNA (cytosine1962-C5)-methyltransferase
MTKNKLATVTLKAGREKSAVRAHPWIFSGAIQSEPSSGIEPGGAVVVRDARGKFVAHGYYNPHSQIRVRTLSLNEAQPWDRVLLERRLKAAIARRDGINRDLTTAVRLVASEADLLPGLIVDTNHNHVVFQILTAGMERMRSDIIELLGALLHPITLVERSDDRNRLKEGLEERKELITGSQDQLVVSCLENGMQLLVDIWNGHKTGFYIDQRDSRKAVGEYARGARVLNLFSYTGGFSVAAALGGASHVVSVDQSAEALELARRNCELNSTHGVKFEFVQADVFDYVRSVAEAGEKYDLVIVDPPKFVTSKAHIDRATRGYKDLNLYALRLLNDHGVLATFSCSGLVTPQLFWQVIFGATVDAPCQLQFLRQLQQAEDHPLLASFPESLYLKGFLGRKIPW